MPGGQYLNENMKVFIKHYCEHCTFCFEISYKVFLKIGQLILFERNCLTTVLQNVPVNFTDCPLLTLQNHFNSQIKTLLKLIILS